MEDTGAYRNTPPPPSMRPTPSGSVTPGFAVPQQQLLDAAQKAMQAFADLLGPLNGALTSQRSSREDPLSTIPLLLDDANSTAVGAANPLLVEINQPHQTIYFQESNSISAYIWYRPMDKAYDSSSRWIKLKVGDKVNWPFPVQKAYIWYPSQALLTGKLLLLKYGDITTATVNTISLNAGSGSSLKTNVFGDSGTGTTAPLTQVVAAILQPLTTRTKAWLYNGGANDAWLGDNNVVFGARGFPLLAGERIEWTNTGPLYGICAAGLATTIYGMDEEQ